MSNLILKYYESFYIIHFVKIQSKSEIFMYAKEYLEMC